MNALHASPVTKLVPNKSWYLEAAIKGAADETTFECLVAGRVGDGFIRGWGGSHMRSNVWQIVAKNGSEDIILYTRNPDLKGPFTMALNSKVAVQATNLGIDQQGRRAFLVSNLI